MNVDVRHALREVMADRGRRGISCAVTFDGAVPVAARYARVSLRGDGLDKYTDPRPGDAFKLHLPSVAGEAVPVPGYDERGRLVWPPHLTGRPIARCFTVQSFDRERRELSFDALRHPGGATEQWLADARKGDVLSLTGMRVEFVETAPATAHLLVGDESALPAITAIVASLSTHATADAFILTSSPRDELPGLAGAIVHLARTPQELVHSVNEHAPSSPDAQVWIGAEAAVVREVRRILLDVHGFDRDAVHASAYWKRGLDWERAFDESLDKYLAAADAGLDVGDPGVLQRLTFD